MALCIEPRLLAGPLSKEFKFVSTQPFPFRQQLVDADAEIVSGQGILDSALDHSAGKGGLNFAPVKHCFCNEACLILALRCKVLF